jgi:hypothetical protein
MTSPSAFVPHAWHDNPVYAIRLAIGDPDVQDWRSDLVLDIDHILAWPDQDRGQFQVVPATLTFHHAADLVIAVDCGDTGGQVALHELSIDCITRERVPDQKVCLDRPYWRWRIALNWPQGGAIAFAGSGYTQVLRGTPMLSDTPRLPAGRRRGGGEVQP